MVLHGALASAPTPPHGNGPAAPQRDGCALSGYRAVNGDDVRRVRERRRRKDLLPKSSNLNWIFVKFDFCRI
ncbi:hypothetical protein [Streptomyces synnematoformans]|uniref:hypothetical protein n=1 Tax=Streptomyces synnematoformans TaxID=415721 RepID=UPI0031D71BB4